MFYSVRRRGEKDSFPFLASTVGTSLSSNRFYFIILTALRAFTSTTGVSQNGRCCI
jgi:hypothetical protein